MRIYKLTQIGSKVAANVTNPDSSNWRVIHTLRSVGSATPDQIAINAGLDENETIGCLMLLKRKGIVEEV